MRTLADTELQAQIFAEIQKLNGKRRKLEEDIRAVDVANRLRVEQAALRDIDAYRNLQQRLRLRQP